MMYNFSKNFQGKSHPLEISSDESQVIDMDE
jgi:hypothetical protein